jgi:hypothetical protein
MKNFATVRNLGHRLKAGMIVDMGGENGLYEVIFVNESRARIEPIEKTRTVIITNRFAGEDEAKEKTFQARRQPLDISPNSEIPIVTWPKK